MKNTLLLDALATWRVFILYRVILRDTGKTDKVPVSPFTGEPIDGQDPNNWMLPHTALVWATQWGEGYGVGLVIAEGSGLFCIDLDNCRDPTTGGWFPHVRSFEDRFPKAYKETSVSHGGRHIMGRYAGEPPTHGTRNKVYRMESYTRRRFIAVTGYEAVGDILADCTDALMAFLGEFFPVHEEAEHGVEWTTKPVAAWKGPTDDDELIRRAGAAVRPKAIFGAGAAFLDLWNANGDVLGRIFPSQNTHSAWNQSSADQALANHLAFYTGNNCEHMLALMKRSKLVREKWNRPDYLKRTILDACATQREWYIDSTLAQSVAGDSRSEGSAEPDGGKLAPTPHSVPLPPTTPPVVVPKPPRQRGDVPEPGTHCTTLDMQEMFEGYCYVEDINAIQRPDGTALTRERFDATYGGPYYAVTLDGSKPTKSAWEAYTQSEIYAFPRAATQYFRPDERTGALRQRDGHWEINCYRPVEVRRMPGDATPFLDLVKRMLPNGNDATILISYMAACVQNLGVKFSWCPFLQGTKGNGKTTIAQILEYCISFRYTHWVKADQLGEKFNSTFVDKLLLIVDEMHNNEVAGFSEILRQLVTATRLEIRRMFVEKMMRDVCYNLFLISNHKNGVRIEPDERRYAPLFCAQQSLADRIRDGLTGDYFIKLREWLWGNNNQGAAIVYDYLMSYQIPDVYNPAKDCVVAPTTTSSAQAVTESMGGVEQEILEAVKQEHDGFRGGWISSQAVDFLIARCGKDRFIPRHARKNLIMGLGYIPHPSLPDGRLVTPLADGHKPTLYVAKGHSWAVDYLTADQVREGFLEAQKKTQ